MMKWITTVMMCLVWSLGTTLYAEPIQIQLGNGEAWNGSTGQTVIVEVDDRGTTKRYEGEITRATDDYIIVDGEFIFVRDIVSIKSDGDVPDPVTAQGTESQATTSDSNATKTMTVEGDLPKGVFVLPLHKMVGTYFRATELIELADHIDEIYGPGQIIVLEIDSGGGSVLKWSELRDAVFEIRERHRIVAWITYAISGAAASGFLCDEIYYKSRGELGSITMYSGHIDNVAPDWQLYGWITELEGVLAKSSHTPLVAGCMVKVRENFSYTKDPVTGEITYFADDTGEVVLSKSGRNLTLGAQEAFDAGLCDGIADTTDELAAMLDLDEWIELDQFGREIAEAWWETLDTFDEEFPDLRSQLGGDVQGSTAKQRINNQIKAGKDILRWADKLGETAEMYGLSEDRIDQVRRTILDLKRELQLVED